MKKVFKSISVLVLSLALAVSGLTFVQTAKADAGTEWSASAVKTPTAGSLVGAGYIDVEFDNSLPGYTYEVFLDDNPVYWKDGNILRPELGEDTSQGTRKTFTTSDTPKTEVYTTEVAEHQITVKATRPNNPTYTSNPVTFYVSKKGLAMGDNMGTKVSLKKLNCSWYYNWGTKAFNNSVDKDVAHIPMMWGGGDDNKEEMATFQSSSNYFLGFNEPDIEGQANMNLLEAYDVWKEYIAPLKMRKVSPAPAAPGGDSAWLKSFVLGDKLCITPKGKLDYYYKFEDNPDIQPIDLPASNVDAVCLHSYQISIDIDLLVSAVKKMWNTYHKPIWVTEIGLFGQKGGPSDKSYENEAKRTQIKEFLTEVVDELEALPYVERYCWFPYDIESANAIDSYDGSGATSMFEYATGLYTELGRIYSGLANPANYNASSISNSEMFNWDNRVRTDVSYDGYSDKVKMILSKGALTNLSRVEVKIDDGEPVVVRNGDEISTSGLDEGVHAVEFTLYDDNNKTVVTKTRAFTVKRADLPTTQAPTIAPVKPSVKPVVKPSKTSIKGKNVKKKSAKLSWGAVSGAKKYKFNWAMNKKFTKKSKVKIVTKTSYKVKKLKKKKTYYFRVAAMNDAGIGPWSNTKKIKIKK